MCVQDGMHVCVQDGMHMQGETIDLNIQCYCNKWMYVCVRLCSLHVREIPYLLFYDTL